MNIFTITFGEGGKQTLLEALYMYISHLDYQTNERIEREQCAIADRLIVNIHNTKPDTKPKHDPCRPFQEGDRVRMVMRDGRYPKDHGRCKELIVPTDNICTVIRDEYDGLVQVKYENGYNPVVPFCFLELVTPVEELERYYIEHDTTGFAIVDRLNVGYVAHFKAVQHPHAKEAAEAECARLNAEYRKEQQ